MEIADERAAAKNCPACGQRQVIRRNGETGEEFLGCSQWPACGFTEPLPIDMTLRRQGAAYLPGFE